MTGEESQKYRQRVYAIQNEETLGLSETLERLLETGREYLGVANGHVKRTYPERGVHRVVASVGADGLVEVGERHDHATTFCRRTLEADSPLAVSDATDGEWADDPAREAHDCECYVGTSLTVGGEAYGTACFVSRRPRPDEFSPEERAFVEFLGRVVETELTVEQYTRKLENRDRLLATLNRVLRHNVRNDMNVVRGNAEMLADRLEGDDEEYARTIASKATDLVALGEEARELEALVEEGSPPSPVDVAEVVESVAVDLRAAAPSGTVSVTVPTDARVLGDDHLRTALYELGDNALRHAGPEPTVEFAVEPGDDDRVTVVVSDDGPGLPELEREILQGQEETQLAHGQGLGLWLVYWGVADAGGEITVDVDDGTTVRVHLLAAPGEGSEPDEWVGDLHLERATLW